VIWGARAQIYQAAAPRLRSALCRRAPSLGRTLGARCDEVGSARGGEGAGARARVRRGGPRGEAAVDGRRGARRRRPPPAAPRGRTRHGAERARPATWPRASGPTPPPPYIPPFPARLTPPPPRPGAKRSLVKVAELAEHRPDASHLTGAGANNQGERPDGSLPRCDPARGRGNAPRLPAGGAALALWPCRARARPAKPTHAKRARAPSPSPTRPTPRSPARRAS
jgi:hypothetical protein